MVRTGGFAADELWTVTLPLPAAGTVTTLTNRWDRDGLGVTLVGFGSPTIEHSGEFRWVAKWWGDHPDRTWSLGMKLDADLDGRRLTVVGVADQNGRTVEIAEHQGADHRLQAVFIRPTSEAREVRITLAVQRSRFVAFLARPEFVK